MLHLHTNFCKTLVDVASIAWLLSSRIDEAPLCRIAAAAAPFARVRNTRVLYSLSSCLICHLFVSYLLLWTCT